jgi:hypothetical protein|nr:MAG TPA: Protein of unknown function (DUF3277) [Caudoviricetes sp.]
MAITRAFTIENTVITVNGRIISDWGGADPAYQDEPIDPKRVLMRGLGGNATVLERSNPGRRVTLNLKPGSADSSFLQGLYNSGSVITLTQTQVGAIDGAIGTEGVMTQEQTKTRAGASTISDDVFVFEFNKWESSRGGEL